MGYWEMSPDGSPDNFMSFDFDPQVKDVLSPCLKSSSISFRGTLALINCPGNCTSDDMVQAAVCPPDGRLRFTRTDGLDAWTAIEALTAKLLFMGYNKNEIDSNDTISNVVLPNCKGWVRTK